MLFSRAPAPPNHDKLVARKILMSITPTTKRDGSRRKDVEIYPFLLRHPRQSRTSVPWMNCSATMQSHMGPRGIRPQECSHELLPRFDMGIAYERGLLPLLNPDIPLHVYMVIRAPPSGITGTAPANPLQSFIGMEMDFVKERHMPKSSSTS